MPFVNASHPEFVAAVRTSQLIVGSLALGVLLFAGVVLHMHGLMPWPERWEDIDPTAAAAPLFALLVLPIQWIVPRLTTAAGVRMQGLDDPARADDPDAWQAWFGLYQTQLIIGCALCEGIAFMSLAFYMMFRQSICLPGAALLWIVILLKFPTPEKVQAWIEARQRRIRDDARFG